MFNCVDTIFEVLSDPQYISECWLQETAWSKEMVKEGLFIITEQNRGKEEGKEQNGKEQNLGDRGKEKN